MNKFQSIAKNLISRILDFFPHHKFQRRIKLTELLGDLCLIRSELNFELNEYSEKVYYLNNLYNTTIHLGPVSNSKFIELKKLENEIQDKSKKVNNLISINNTTTESINKLKDNDYIGDPTIEKGFSSTIKRASSINVSYNELSQKISNLSLVRTA